jgi:hypothetical protein
MMMTCPIREGAGLVTRFTTTKCSESNCHVRRDLVRGACVRGACVRRAHEAVAFIVRLSALEVCVTVCHGVS